MFKTWIARWLYPALVQRKAERDAADTWSAHVPKCKFCERPLMVECQFCPHCGYDLTEKHTTAQVKLVDVRPIQPASVPKTPTGVIRAYQVPGERPHQTLRRMGWKANG